MTTVGVTAGVIVRPLRELRRNHRLLWSTSNPTSGASSTRPDSNATGSGNCRK